MQFHTRYCSFSGSFHLQFVSTLQVAHHQTIPSQLTRLTWKHASILALCDGQREREREREIERERERERGGGREREGGREGERRDTRACALSSRIEVLCWIPRAGPADRLQFVNVKNLASLPFTVYIVNLRLKTGAYSLQYSLGWFGDINCGMKGSPTSYYPVWAYLRHGSSFKVVVKQGIRMNQDGWSDNCIS